MRLRIAAVAARLMAEDGIDDFGHAKRKAARQLGAEDTQALPNNEEVEAQLRAYQSIYQGEEHLGRVRQLREQALELMRFLQDFRPHLTGPVLKGTAARYGDIDIQLFTDDAKAVELLLLNRGVPYEAKAMRHYAGDQPRPVTILQFDWQGTVANVAVYPANDERSALKTSPAGRAMERAGLHAVAQLLDDA